MPLFSGKVKISPQKEISSTPPPMEFNQATPNAYQMIALCLCNNMTLSLTEAPLKKITWPNGGNRPARRACFVEFSLISANSRKLFRAHD